jgi:hypothetical protein
VESLLPDASLILAAELINLNALALHSLLSTTRTGHVLLNRYSRIPGSTFHLDKQGTKVKFCLGLPFKQIAKANPPSQLLLIARLLQLSASQHSQQRPALIQPSSGPFYLFGVPSPQEPGEAGLNSLAAIGNHRGYQRRAARSSQLSRSLT